MSNWTHVAGIIRIDDFARCLRFSRLGRNSMKKLIEKEIPFGSEGPLQITIWENPDKSCLFAYVVSVFGDLRDHDSATEIVDWFKKICDNFVVRDATITVCNSCQGTVNWTYEESHND